MVPGHDGRMLISANLLLFNAKGLSADVGEPLDLGQRKSIRPALASVPLCPHGASRVRSNDQSGQLFAISLALRCRTRPSRRRL